MARNKPTKEELIDLVKKGANDADLFVLKKIKEIQDDIEEIDSLFDDNEKELNIIDAKIESKEAKIYETIYNTKKELNERIEAVRGLISDIDTTSGLQNVVETLISADFRGKDGKTPTKEELEEIIMPLIPEPIHGKDAEIDETMLASKIVELIDGIDLEEKIDEKLKSIKIDAKNVTGIKDLLPKNPPVYGGGSGATFLKSMRDVDRDSIENASNNQVLIYNSTKKKWIAGTNAGGGSGDMEASVYDPAGGEEQVAFASELADYQLILAEGAFVDGDKTKLDGIETGADVTDTTNVTAAGALMDSEVTNLAQVKAFDSSDYATAAQGALADSAIQSITPTAPTTYTPTGTTQTITFAVLDELAILDLGSATGDVTLAISGMSAGGAYTIHVIQGATARNIIFPSGVKASSNLDAWDQPTRTLTLTATDDALDVVGLSYDGTRTVMTAEFDLS